MQPSENSLVILKDLYGLTSNLQKTLPRLTPGMRSTISGQYESRFSGSAINLFLNDFNDSLEYLIAANQKNGYSLTDVLDWKAYTRLLEPNEVDVRQYAQNPEAAKHVIERGVALEAKFGVVGPPIPVGDAEKKAIYDFFMEHLFVFENMFDSKFVHAYSLLKNALSGKVPDSEFFELIDKIEEQLELLRDQDEFYNELDKAHEVEYTFETRSLVKSNVEKYLGGDLDWGAYSNTLLLEDKIIEIEVASAGLKITPVEREQYPDWKKFGGYETNELVMKNWIDSLEVNYKPHKTLLAGPPGTGKTTLLKAVLREASKRGFTPIYLKRLDGANLSDLESFVSSLKSYLPEDPKIIAAKDDIELNLITNISNREASMTQLTSLPYPLIATVNPDIAIYGMTAETKGIRDEALLRRFTNIFYFGLPTDEERKEIAEIVVSNLDYELKPGDLDEILACSAGKPGAYIELLLNRKPLLPDWSWGKVSENLNGDLEKVAGAEGNSYAFNNSEYQ